jgi:heat shock protein HtpX
VGWVFGEYFAPGYGLAVTPFAIGLSAVSSAGAYFAGDRIVLGMSKAREVTRREEPELHNVTEALAIGAGLPMPKLYLIEDTAPNAFATGRDPKHASVAVTRGLLEKLDRTELEGVLAHELSHVGNRDIRVMLLVAVLVGTVALLADWLMRSMWWGGRRRDRREAGGVIAILAFALALITPLFATLIQLAVSRQREYLADASGALLTRYPPGLASALRKMAADREPLEVANKATAALYIINPLKDAPAFFDGLFDTHPPMAERIRRLEAM